MRKCLVVNEKSYGEGSKELLRIVLSLTALRTISDESLALELDPIAKSVCSVTLFPLILAIPYPLVSTFHTPV